MHYVRKLPQLGKHVHKHHKKYLWGAAGLLWLFKLFSFLLLGLSGYMVTNAKYDWNIWSFYYQFFIDNNVGYTNSNTVDLYIVWDVFGIGGTYAVQFSNDGNFNTSISHTLGELDCSAAQCIYYGRQLNPSLLQNNGNQPRTVYMKVTNLQNSYETDTVYNTIIWDTLAPPAPTCTSSQTFWSSLAVTCTSSDGNITYTTDGSSPTCNSSPRSNQSLLVILLPILVL